MAKIKASAALFVVLLVSACAQPPQSAGFGTAGATAPQTSLPVLMTRARDGDNLSAMVVAALYYRAGNSAAAFQWMQVAANRGYALGQAGLGHAYTMGLGVPQDYGLALK